VILSPGDLLAVKEGDRLVPQLLFDDLVGGSGFSFVGPFEPVLVLSPGHGRHLEYAFVLVGQRLGYVITDCFRRLSP